MTTAQSVLAPPTPTPPTIAQDLVPQEQTLRANLEALAARPPSQTPARGPLDLRHLIPEWLLRPPAPIPDIRAVIEKPPLPHTLPEHKGAAKPYTVEGINPPWLLLRIMRETAPPTPHTTGDDGFRVRVNFLVADPFEFLDGLSHTDMRSALADTRLHIYLGPDASTRLAADLRERLGTIVVGHTLSLAPAFIRTRIAPTPEQVMRATANAQREEINTLAARVRAAYSTRDRAWYAGRFASAQSRRLHILIPTCRFTTFLQHSARDLADALRTLGHEPLVTIEPDECSHNSAAAYLRPIADFQPDLIILINYTRADIGPVIPPNLPLVTWVQDSMPQLFTAAAGKAQTEYDFLAGHTHEELCEQFGYPRARRIPLPVVASETKFHSAPISASQRDRHACDIAVCTHHSETPEAMHARLSAQVRANPAAVRIFERLFPLIHEAVTRAAEVPIQQTLRETAARTAREIIGSEPDARTHAVVINQYTLPMADRMVRHRILHWAADVAEKRAWSLRLYGRGWSSHPRFAKYATGELPHNDDLRASYQAAAVHLHASIHWMFHQRIMECALSGGLPLYFLKADDLSLFRAFVIRHMVERGSPSHSDEQGTPIYPAAADPEALAFVALQQRLGRPIHPAWTGVPITPQVYANARRAWGNIPLDHDAAWLLGELTHTTFSTAADLERAVEHAIESPPRRADLSKGIARRVKKHFTYTRAATTILDAVANAFASSSSN